MTTKTTLIAHPAKSRNQRIKNIDNNILLRYKRCLRMIRLILETISKIITKLILGKSFKRYSSKGGNILKGQDMEMVHSIIYILIQT